MVKVRQLTIATYQSKSLPWDKIDPFMISEMSNEVIPKNSVHEDCMSEVKHPYCERRYYNHWQITMFVYLRTIRMRPITEKM